MINKVILVGRLTREPDFYQGETNVAKYTLAVDRRKKGEADFIPCVAFGRSADFAGNYLHKGTKIAVIGRIQTGKYTNKDGNTVYTTDVIVEDQEFAESKAAQAQTNNDRDFVPILEGLQDELPFR